LYVPGLHGDRVVRRCAQKSGLRRKDQPLLQRQHLHAERRREDSAHVQCRVCLLVDIPFTLLTSLFSVRVQFRGSVQGSGSGFANREVRSVNGNGLLNESERVLRAGRWKRAWAQPSCPQVAYRLITAAAVDDRRSERGAADRILQSDRETADRDRAARETADRQTKSKRRASKRSCKTDRNASDGDQTEREAAKCEAAYRNVADGDDALRGPRPHGDRIDPHADV